MYQKLLTSRPNAVDDCIPKLVDRVPKAVMVPKAVDRMQELAMIPGGGVVPKSFVTMISKIKRLVRKLFSVSQHG